MRILVLEQLASRGVVVIQKKGREWLVQFVRKDEAGFLIDRQSEWGREFWVVINDLLEKVRNAE